MSGIQKVCSVALALSSLMLLWIHRTTHSMVQYPGMIRSSVPKEDPRVLARNASVQVKELTSKIDEHLLTLRALTYTPTPPAKDDRQDAEAVSEVEAKPIVELGEDGVDQMVRERFQQPISRAVLNELESYLDPNRHRLPHIIYLYPDAVSDWIRIRGRWSTPVSRSEIEVIDKSFGFPIVWLETLNPHVTEHHEYVSQKLREGNVDVAKTLDWFGSGFGSPIPGPNERPDFNKVIWRLRNAMEREDSKEIGESLTHAKQLFAQQQDRTIGTLRSLAMVSQINHPDLWKWLNSQAINNTQNEAELVRILDFSKWHRVAVDDASLELIGSLYQSTSLTSEYQLNMAPKDFEDLNDRSPVGADSSLPSSQRMSKWLLMDGPNQDTVFKSLLTESPSEDLRRDILAIANGPKTLDESKGAYASILATSWSGESDIVPLLAKAYDTSPQFATPTHLSPAAEAIVASCRLHPESVDQLAKHWLDEAQWARDIQRAWQRVGRPAEIAFGELLLAMDRAKPAAGTQAALELLASIGGTQTLTLLDIFSSQSNRDALKAKGLDRYLVLCKSRIKGRLAREAELPESESPTSKPENN